ATGLYGVPATVSAPVVLAVVVVVALLLTAFESKALGRAYEIVREDEELARSLGVDTDRARHLAFVVSGMVGTLGGALNVMVLGVVSPTDSGFPVIVLGLTMAIVGGFRSWRGAFIGAALIQSLPIVLQSLGLDLVSDWWPAIYGALIVVIAVYASRGILGLLQDVGRRLRERRKPPPVTPTEPAPEPVREPGRR
ncbi:branched-chain amino acid ABC transporter permease, partial [Pseudonocardia sp. ICBG601]|uniref:branched-chain amino acid ABC transporter permease n=1 Tax=Pseudonocardia sp. ICBG601 TaxID=2846759 RepID=UPI001CF6A16A